MQWSSAALYESESNVLASKLHFVGKAPKIRGPAGYAIQQ